MPVKFKRFFKGLFFSFLLISFSQAIAQKAVTGSVKNKSDNQPILGASIAVKGSNIGTQTNDNGNFNINVPNNNSTLVITVIGFESQEVPVAGKTSLGVITLVPSNSSMNEIVVTGYSSQRKKDIIGAVSVINTDDLKATPAANLAAQLQGRAAGVTVSSTGAPGASAVVRIRGFQSFGNNNPLYIIDGVPTEDPSQLNPQDIESIQVLKDATASAVYGTRAANGVLIVTTRQGKVGRTLVTYENYVGAQIVTDKMVPDMLNSPQYIEYLNRAGATSHPVFGLAGNFKIPDYFVASGSFKGGVAAGDPRANPSLYSLDPLYQIYKTSPEGTNWFDEVTRKGILQSHQLTAAGGTDKAIYSIGFNYFNQQGIFKFTDYERYTVRANSSVKPKSYLRFGENLQVSVESRLGGDQRGEGGAWTQSYRMVPYIPVYDIKGGFGGNAIGESGNGSNPVANLVRGHDDKNEYYKVFGNVFAEITPFKFLTLRSSIGLDYGNQFQRTISRKTYERAENQGTTQLTERIYKYLNWTWTNTMTYQQVIGNNHDVKVLLGTEAIRRNFKVTRAFGQRFDFDNADFISLDRSGLQSGDRNVFNFDNANVPGIGAVTIASLFGRIDYQFKGKYLLNGTLRRDGASVFGANDRFAVFPAVGIGWRLSEENFLKNVPWLTDLKLRAGWGKVGSIGNVPVLNQYSTYTSTAGATNYDINGTNTSAATGYRIGTVGNPTTKWETTESKNIGLDLAILNSKWDLSVNVFSNDTKDLLVTRLRNSLEPLATQPQENIGTMRNTGFEISLNHKGNITSDLQYDVSLNFSHYKNKLIKMNNEGTVRFVSLDRLSNALITKAGIPISSFYGYQIDGFYNTAADVTNGPKIGGNPGIIGTWKYKDISGADGKPDGNITEADLTVLGNPHPDFQLGTNIGLNYKSLDFSMFLFWNQGNELYNYTKYYTDMRVFVGGISTRVLNDTWTTTNMNAKLPQLQKGADGFTGFVTGNSNSYYVEDGSYLRAKTIQLGYTFPKKWVERITLTNIRLYVQAQNLFTITKYQGADPDLNLINNNVDNITTDTYIGVDRGGFPNPKQVLVGLNVTF